MPRNLRFAASGFFFVLAIAFVALWVRSYERRDTLLWLGTSRGWEISSLSGHAILIIMTQETSGEGLPSFTTRHEKINPGRTLSFKNNVLGFLYRPQPSLVRIDVPFWFLMLMGMVGAAVALLRKWRFTVRGLLIGTTVVAAALGLAVWAI